LLIFIQQQKRVVVPLTFIIIPLNSVLLPPVERRINTRCCTVNGGCIRLSTENDPESEEDGKIVRSFSSEKERLTSRIAHLEDFDDLLFFLVLFDLLNIFHNSKHIHDDMLVDNLNPNLFFIFKEFLLTST
jgi:hypothetical protein